MSFIKRHQVILCFFMIPVAPASHAASRCVDNKQRRTEQRWEIREGERETQRSGRTIDRRCCFCVRGRIVRLKGCRPGKMTLAGWDRKSETKREKEGKGENETEKSGEKRRGRTFVAIERKLSSNSFVKIDDKEWDATKNYWYSGVSMHIANLSALWDLLGDNVSNSCLFIQPENIKQY